MANLMDKLNRLVRGSVQPLVVNTGANLFPVGEEQLAQTARLLFPGDSDEIQAERARRVQWAMQLAHSRTHQSIVPGDAWLTRKWRGRRTDSKVVVLDDARYGFWSFSDEKSGENEIALPVLILMVKDSFFNSGRDRPEYDKDPKKSDYVLPPGVTAETYAELLKKPFPVYEGGTGKEGKRWMPKELVAPVAVIPLRQRDVLRATGRRLKHPAYYMLTTGDAMNMAPPLSHDKRTKDGKSISTSTHDLTVAEIIKEEGDWGPMTGMVMGGLLARYVVTALTNVYPLDPVVPVPIFAPMQTVGHRDFVFTGYDQYDPVTGKVTFYQRDVRGAVKTDRSTGRMITRSFYLGTNRPFLVQILEWIWANDLASFTDPAKNDKLMAFRVRVINGMKSFASEMMLIKLRQQELLTEGLTVDAQMKLVKDAVGRGEVFLHLPEVAAVEIRSFKEEFRPRRLAEIRNAAEQDRWSLSDAQKEADDDLWKDTTAIGGQRVAIVTDDVMQRYLIGTQDQPGSFWHADWVTERSKLEPMVALGGFGRAEVSKAIGDGFGKKTCAGRAKLYLAAASGWEDITAAQQRELEAGKLVQGLELRPGYHWQFYRDVVYDTAKGSGLTAKVQSLVMSVPPLRRIWKARQLSEWKTEVVSLADAKAIRRVAMDQLPGEGEDGWGLTVHVVRGYPLWPKWLAIGDTTDLFNCGILTMSGNARTLNSVQPFIMGGYGSNVTNPEVELKMKYNLILTPWGANQQADKLMFFIRKVLAGGLSDLEIEKDLGNMFAAGFHPQFFYGDEWRHNLTHVAGLQVDDDAIDLAERLIDWTYLASLGRDVFKNISMGQMPDLDILCEDDEPPTATEEALYEELIRRNFSAGLGN